MKCLKQTLLSIALVSITVVAQAYEAGDIIVRVGIANVEPNDDSDPILGTKIEVDNGIALGFTGTYMLSDKIGIELLASTPFKHDLDLGNGAPAGETKHLPPTLSIQYYPMDSAAEFQPYVGVGVNYTMFFEEKTNQTTLPGTKLSLDDSFGFAVEAGFDYAINEDWGVGLEIWYVDIETEATISGATNAKVDVEIDPVVFMAGLSYKF